MDRKKIEELMQDLDYVYRNTTEFQGVPLTETNVNIIHSVQQVLKKTFIELNNELNRLKESEKEPSAEEPEIIVEQVDESAAEKAEEAAEAEEGTSDDA